MYLGKFLATCWVKLTLSLRFEGLVICAAKIQSQSLITELGAIRGKERSKICLRCITRSLGGHETFWPAVLDVLVSGLKKAGWQNVGLGHSCSLCRCADQRFAPIEKCLVQGIQVPERLRDPAFQSAQDPVFGQQGGLNT